MNLPTLYKVDNHKKIREWKVWYEAKGLPGIIYVEHGVQGGAKQIKTTMVYSGKNIGKANETSVLEQCINEAKSKWNKQLDKGYSQTIPTEKQFTPMLAHRFDKYPHKVKYPAFIQVKLDGARFTMTCNDNKIVGESRAGKPFCVPHIVESLSEVLKKNSRYILDGELFTREITFQEILSAIKREEPNELTGKVQYWVYDIYDKENPKLKFKDRLNLLKKMPKLDYVKIVNTYSINSEEDIIKWHNHNVSEGFEGSIIRNAGGVYKLGRSYDLLKVKDFQDEEFEIVDKKLDKNGECVFSCVTDGGAVFDVKPMGEHDVRRQYYYDDNIGKMLNVRFFEWTSSDSPCPRFPVGVYIRHE